MVFRLVDLVLLVKTKTIIFTALTREGTTERLFVNGNLIGTQQIELTITTEIVYI